MLRSASALVLLPWLPAQAAWTLLSPPSSPSARTEVAMDSDGSGALLFGGQFGPTLTAYAELWRFDGATWTLQVPVGASPPPRSRFAAAFDPVRQRFVVFGGDAQYSTGGALGDTWEWDPALATWTQLAPAVAPSARIHARMAFDLANVQLLLFGGSSGGDQTWSWDGATWTQRAPSNVPPARQQTHLATDWTNGDVVMFGGAAGATAGILGDTWRWDGSDWTPVTTATMPGGGLRNGKMTYDSLRERIVVHGGIRATAGFSASAWEFDGVDWVERLPTPTPAGRTGAGFCYVPALGTNVLFGGYNGGVFGDSWTYQTDAPATRLDYGAGCASSVGVPALGTTPLPWLGETLTWTIGNLPPGGLPLLVVGVSDSIWAGGSLPFPLAVLGAPGCDLLASPDTLTFAPGAVTLPIPVNASLIAFELFAQAVVLEPVGANLAFALSAATALTIGAR